MNQIFLYFLRDVRLKKLDWWRKKCDNFIWFFYSIFLFNCTFFRDLNQVRSTSLKLDKYFFSFVQEKCSISFLSYISTIALFLFLERIVLSSIYLLLLSIDTLLVGIYFFFPQVVETRTSLSDHSKEN